jgi:hypothetical protein
MSPVLGKNYLGAILVAVTCVVGVADRHAVAQASEGKAPTTADRHETSSWLLYGNGDTGDFRYPPGWKVEPILWQSAAQEADGEGPDEIGTTIEGPHGGAITIGGRGATACDEYLSPKPECKCLSIYVAVYTCDGDAETRHIYNLLVTTIRNDYPNSDFTVLFPAAQAALHPNRRYTLRWRTKSGIPRHNVHISVLDTSKEEWRDAIVLDIKRVPNTGRYDWLVPPSITSPGPYLLEVSSVVRQEVKPPAQGGGRIYYGISSPFYIQ